jgi:hypothetical protein
MPRNCCSALSACLAAGLLLWGCDLKSPIDSPPGELAAGTWGGENVGLIVNDTVAHVHVGCTYGDFPAPVRLDADGRFSVSGDYLLTAYPIPRGPTMPAEFAGVLRGRTLAMTVAVNDTIEKRLVVLGPATVTLGVDPQMGPCPICVSPGERVTLRARSWPGRIRWGILRFFSRR